MQQELTLHRRRVHGNSHSRQRERTNHSMKVKKCYHSAHKSRLHSAKPPLTVIGPLKVILFTIWSLSLVSSLALDVIADLFQDNVPQFPLEPVTIMSIGLSVFSSLLTMVIGCGSKKRFLFFQPFVGGEAFVVMQAVGYTLASTSCSLKVMFVHETYHPHTSRYGALSVLGIFTTIAQLFLMASLQFFIPPPKAVTTTTTTTTVAAAALSVQKTSTPSKTLLQSWKTRLSISPTREYVFITVLLFTLTLTSTVAEYYPAFREVNVAIIFTFVVASMGVIHFVITRQYMPGYCFVDPFTLSWNLALVQVSGNMLLFSSLCGDVMLFYTAAHSPPSWHIGSGLVAVTGVCAHLLLIRLIGLHPVSGKVNLTEQITSSSSSSTANIAKNDNSNEVVAANTTSPVAEKHTAPSYLPLETPMQKINVTFNAEDADKFKQSSTTTTSTTTTNTTTKNTTSNSSNDISTLTRHMPVLATLVSVMMGAVVYIITFALSSSRLEFPADVSVGLRQVQQLLATLMFVLPPFSHMQGHFLFGSDYEIWSPFNGTTEFILLQGAGWAGFGFAVFFATLNATEKEHFHFLLLHTTYILLSQLFIHVSLHIFEQDLITRHASLPLSPTSASTTTTTITSPTNVTISSSEETLSSLLERTNHHHHRNNHECATTEPCLPAHTTKEVNEESISSLASSESETRKLVKTSTLHEQQEEKYEEEYTRTVTAAGNQEHVTSFAVPCSLELATFTKQSQRQQHDLHEHPEHELQQQQQQQQQQLQQQLRHGNKHASLTALSPPLPQEFSPTHSRLSSSLLSPLSSKSASLVSTVVNGELLLSLILATVAMVLRGICDGMAYNKQRELNLWRVPVESIANAALILNLLSTPIAQLSMRDRFPLLHSVNADCSSGFAALQAIAWSVYTLLMTVLVINWAGMLIGNKGTTVAMRDSSTNMNNNNNIYNNNSNYNNNNVNTTSRMSIQTSVGFHFGLNVYSEMLLAYTCQGLLFTLPLICVIVSDFFETLSLMHRRYNECRVQRATHEMMTLLDHEQLFHTPEERVRFQRLLRTIAGPQVNLKLEDSIATSVTNTISGNYPNNNNNIYNNSNNNKNNNNNINHSTNDKTINDDFTHTNNKIKETNAAVVMDSSNSALLELLKTQSTVELSSSSHLGDVTKKKEEQQQQQQKYLLSSPSQSKDTEFDFIYDDYDYYDKNSSTCDYNDKFHLATRHAAQCLCAIMCIACLVAFLSAVFLASVEPVTTLVFMLAGMIILTLSCVSLHGIYGTRIYSLSGKYTFFMPFAGGVKFVLYQALGWCCYTACLCLAIACVVELQGSVLAFTTMSVLSVISQVALLKSIGLFNTQAVDISDTVIGRNAEALLAVVLLLGIFCFARMYEMLSEGKATTHASSLVSVILFAIALCLSVPFGLASLQRQAKRFGVSPLLLLYNSLIEGYDDDDDDEEEEEEEEKEEHSGEEDKEGNKERWKEYLNIKRRNEMIGNDVNVQHNERHADIDVSLRNNSRSLNYSRSSTTNYNLINEPESDNNKEINNVENDDNEGVSENNKSNRSSHNDSYVEFSRESTTCFTSRYDSSNIPTRSQTEYISFSEENSNMAETLPVQRAATEEVEGTFVTKSSSLSAELFTVAKHQKRHLTRRARRSRSSSHSASRLEHRAAYVHYAMTMTYGVTMFLGMFLVTLMPFIAILMLYAYLHGAAITLGIATQSMKLLVMFFALLLLVPLVISPIVQRSRVVREVHAALACWVLYCIPTFTIVGGLLPPLLVPNRSALLFSANMVVMSCFSTIPHVHLMSFIWSVCYFAYYLQYHLYMCGYEHRYSIEWSDVLGDFAVSVFWIWYNRRFAGQPHLTGRFRSRRATRFFQKYFFDGLVHYFSTRVVVCAPYTLPCDMPRSSTSINNSTEKKEHEEYQQEEEELLLNQDKTKEKNGNKNNNYNNVNDNDNDDKKTIATPHCPPRVNLYNPENQYLFSFHPHGVFPGTTVTVPNIPEWERAVGHNSQHFISTHCADVVFSVPIMREFPMCLGAMSVSRRAIEYSIKHGNSPLIVTGGQSELLLTRSSNLEMHLVCHHTGFIRLTLTHKIPLVPILSFAENNVMDNVHILKLQRWCMKKVGFPFPVCPYGRWYLPLPRNRPLMVLVGEPLLPLPGRDDPEDAACIQEMCERYFRHVEYLFYRYRAEAGYPNMKLYLHNGIDDPGVTATFINTTSQHNNSNDNNNNNDDDIYNSKNSVNTCVNANEQTMNYISAVDSLYTRNTNIKSKTSKNKSSLPAQSNELQHAE